MIDLAGIQSSFPELDSLVILSTYSAQRVVLAGNSKGSAIVLKLSVSSSLDTLQRMRREVNAVSALAHPRIPTIYDIGVRTISTFNVFYIIEQRIDGQTYRDVLLHTPRQPMNRVRVLCDTMLELIEALDGLRLVHRDIKPENMIVDTNGDFWLIDFGIVRDLNLASLTSPGLLWGLGTPGYAAPEQFRNLRSIISAKADLFSLGIVMYESIEGGNPFLSIHDPILRYLHMEQYDLPRLVVQGAVTNDIADFTSSIASRFPARRPTPSEARDWFRSI